MSSRPDLKLDWCDAKAARYACQKWHYSRTMPASGVKIGVWEDGLFLGCVLYGVGAGNVTRGEKYGLARSHEIAELMRVALDGNRISPTSKIVAISLKMLKKQSPKIRMVVSFADMMGQGHIGTIYQACGFVYSGTFDGDVGFLINGKIVHSKTVHSMGWVQSVEWLQKHIDPHCKKMPTLKHRYLWPMDAEMRERIKPLAKPYPKRAGSADSGTPSFQPGRGGAIPTPALSELSVQ